MRVCERRHSRRILAAITGLWLLVCVVAGARHEGEVRHCTDRQGNTVHAPKMVGAHTGETSDFHATDGDGDHDVCAIVAALHQASSLATARLAIVDRRVDSAHTPLFAPTHAVAEQIVYRLAPKTSPPLCS